MARDDRLRDAPERGGVVRIARDSNQRSLDRDVGVLDGRAGVPQGVGDRARTPAATRGRRASRPGPPTPRCGGRARPQPACRCAARGGSRRAPAGAGRTSHRRRGRRRRRCGPAVQHNTASRPTGGSAGIRPHVALYPTTPQQEAGTRIEPPMSEPVASSVVPAASAAADPPLDPPGWRDVPRVARNPPHPARGSRT